MNSTPMDGKVYCLNQLFRPKTDYGHEWVGKCKECVQGDLGTKVNINGIAVKY